MRVFIFALYMFLRLSALRDPLALIAACALSALCAHAQNREVLGEYRIGIVGCDQGDASYQATQCGAQDAARALSAQYSIDVELLNATPSPEQGESQTTSLAELFVENADGFLISPEAPERIRGSIEFAQAQGQQVVLFEHQLEDLQPLAALVADEVEAGRLAAQAILKTLPTKGRVAILTSEQADAGIHDRLQGARAALGYRRIEKIVPCAPNYAAAIAAIRATQAADRNHRITGWLFLDDWPLLGMPALPWKAGELSCVAIQSSPSALMYIDQGYVNALIVHPYYEWGHASMTALVNQLHNGRAPDAPTVLTAPRIVDWSNLDAYRDNWKSWLK